MKFYWQKRNKVGLIDRRDKCRVFVMHWIFVDLRILGSMGFHSLGVIEDLGLRMCEFILIEVSLRWIGF